MSGREFKIGDKVIYNPPKLEGLVNISTEYFALDKQSRDGHLTITDIQEIGAYMYARLDVGGDQQWTLIYNIKHYEEKS
jgi:hypothetical protein